MSNQTWKQFYRDSTDKKVILFGAGVVAELYWERFVDACTVASIVDNDRALWGLEAKVVLPSSRESYAADYILESPTIIEKYSTKETVILVANATHTQEIVSQIKTWGDFQCYIITEMELNSCRYTGREDIGDYRTLKLAQLLYKKYSSEEIDPKKIVFYDMGRYSGHGKYITEQLLKFRSDLDIVWILKDKTVNIPKQIRVVDKQTKLSGMRELATAKMWVFDYKIPLNIKKRCGQIYINVKHWSSITLKTFGLDLALFRNESSDWVLSNGRQIDYAITGSQFDQETFRKGFAFQGEFLNFGSARSDILFNSRIYKEKICSFYQLSGEKKLLLYAPTFRLEKNDKRMSAGACGLNFCRLKQTLDETFGGDWSILLRLHPNVAEESGNIERLPYVVDATDYEDSQELVAAADIVITDYSSIMFEPAFVRKPVFLCSLDRREYINIERELLIDYNSLPFSIADSNEELCYNIETFDYEKYVQDVDAFMEKYGVHEDGHASERAAQFISDLIDGKV